MDNPLTDVSPMNYDVYNFGAFLLEQLSGWKAIDQSQQIRKPLLLTKVKPYLEDQCEIFRILDKHVEGRYSKDSLQGCKAAKLTL